MIDMAKIIILFGIIAVFYFIHGSIIQPSIRFKSHLKSFRIEEDKELEK